MAALSSVNARCLNCKKPVKPDQEVCVCGDRVKPRAHVAVGPGATYSASATVTGTGSFSGLPEVTPGIQLTDEQRHAVATVKEWFTSCRSTVYSFRLFGPAGTGKTTIVKHIAEALGVRNVVYGAYTGKAAHVLRRKGVPATTIHSAIYQPVDNYKAHIGHRAILEEIAAWKEGPGPRGMERTHRASLPELEAELEQIEEAMRRPRFDFNPMSEWASADLIVLDEVSMVNEKMAADIESYGVPVLVLGDPAQLPPVSGEGHYTNAEPDVLLTEVHRQALESPVLALATEIRAAARPAIPRVKVNLAEAMEADQIIVWKNSTRWNLISRIREKLGRPAGEPVPGDRIMCLVNNKDAGLLNGQQFEVLDGLGLADELLVRDDEGIERVIRPYMEAFAGLEAEQQTKRTERAFRGPRGLFTFAQVITAHKSQGSEWPHVYVVDQTWQMTQSSGAEKRAWLYTAVSRASERVTIASTRV